MQLATLLGSLKTRNVVVRDVRDGQANRLAIIVERYDGTEVGLIEASRRATARMHEMHPEASDIQSRIAATDLTGTVRWSVSPNLLHIAEMGTDEAEFIWCGKHPFKR